MPGIALGSIPSSGSADESGGETQRVMAIHFLVILTLETLDADTAV